MRLFFLLLLLVFSVQIVGAQEVHQELKETVRADVIKVLEERDRPVMGTGATTTVQTLRINIREGVREGSIISFENDYILVEEGDTIFVNRLVTINGDEYYVLKDVDRRSYLIVLVGLFVGLLIWFAGKQGVRALVSLGLSVMAILFILVPALLAGYNPALASLCIAGLILAVVLFGTHGINPRSIAAFAGTFSAVLLTCGVAAFFVGVMRLTGFGSDASVYLNLSTGGQLDFGGLLLGSIIIGILGVLDDVSITQASVVQELKLANNTLRLRSLYSRAIRVGRDHVGSLVNTLALAYVGVSLPLVLLFARADSSLALTLNQEVVAAELVRIIVGSIGLILAVPLTTFAAAWWFDSHEVDESDFGGHTHHHH